MRPIVLGLLVLCVLALVEETPSRAQPAIPVPVLVDAGPAPVTSDIATAPPAETPPDSTTTVTTTTTTTPTKDAGGLMYDVVSAVRGGQWRLAIAGILGLLMLGLAKVRNHARSPFKGDRGGAALVLVLSLLTAFGTALASSAPLGLDLVIGALGAALTAAGGYSIFRKLIWPKVA